MPITRRLTSAFSTSSDNSGLYSGCAAAAARARAASSSARAAAISGLADHTACNAARQAGGADTWRKSTGAASSAPAHSKHTAPSDAGRNKNMEILPKAVT